MALDTAKGGILPVHKPAGMTSFAVIARLRKFTGIRRIGHVGTLDPFAEGLLPICIGRAARMVRFMDDYEKTYRLTVAFGRATDTLDPTGRTLDEQPVPEALLMAWRRGDCSRLERAAAALSGQQMQVPPVFSAVKIDGQPLYAYARRGEVKVPQPRAVLIRRLELIDWVADPVPQATFLVTCSKGTYMRVLAAELGAALDVPAHASALVRLASGPFTLEQSVAIRQLDAWWDAEPDCERFWSRLLDEHALLPEEQALAGLPELELELDLALAADLVSGRPAYLKQAPAAQLQQAPRLVCRYRGRLVAVAAIRAESAGLWRIISERVLLDHAELRGF